MKLWLDDNRPPPSGKWTWCRTVLEAKLAIVEHYKVHGFIEEISFDHDLGDGVDGIELAKWIEKKAFNGKLRILDWNVHSANPAGRRNIEAAMRSAARFWRNENDNS